METVAIQGPAVNQQAAIVERLVGITLEEGDYSAINATKQDLARVTSYLLEQYARGGIMIPATKVRYLSDTAGVPVVSANDVLEIVDNVVHRKTPNGTLRVTYDVDPSFVGPLEDVARAQGRTLEAIVQEGLTLVLTNSWLYALPLDGLTAVFTSDARQRLERLMGTDQITGQSILEFTEGLASKGVQRREKPMVQVKEK